MLDQQALKNISDYLEELGVEEAEIQSLLKPLQESPQTEQTPNPVRTAQDLQAQIAGVDEADWRKKAALTAMLISFKLDNNLY